MEVTIQTIDQTKAERVIIQCHKVTEEIKEIHHFIKSRDTMLEVYQANTMKHVPLHSIYYIEAVDNKVFVYLAKEVYEIKMKLYEFEKAHNNQSFFRCSKQHIVNLMKIVDVTPALNGRFQAKLSNNETMIISRKYVNQLLSILRGENL